MNYEIKIKCNNHENYQRVLNKIKFQFEKHFETNSLSEDEENFTINLKLSKFPFIAFERDNMQMIESNNNYEVTIKISGDYDILKYGYRIHKQLVALQEYIDSDIVLNYTDSIDTIYILISDKCNIVPLFFRDYK